MADVKCPMCSEVLSSIGGVVAHMSKGHGLDFSDKEDMNRRLQAVGFDPVHEPEQAPERFIDPTRIRTLHG